MIKHVVIAVVLVGCKGGDKCERAWDKMAPAMAAEQKSAKSQAQPPDRSAMVAECKAELAKHPEREAMLDCVIAIDGEVTMDKLTACASAKGKDGESPRRHGGAMTEAKLMLNKIGKSAKVYYVTNAGFPKGKVGLTPATECCAASDKHTCVNDAKTWTDPMWTALDFQIDEPSNYRYSYESDGQTFTALAVGDLDCDTEMATFTLTGSAEGGNPKVDLKEPAKPME
jgi:hypothetical protein